MQFIISQLYSINFLNCVLYNAIFLFSGWNYAHFCTHRSKYKMHIYDKNKLLFEGRQKIFLQTKKFVLRQGMAILNIEES